MVQSTVAPVLKTSSFKTCCNDHEKNTVLKLLLPSADAGADILKETSCPLANIQLYSPSAIMSTVLSARRPDEHARLNGLLRWPSGSLYTPSAYARVIMPPTARSADPKNTNEAFQCLRKNPFCGFESIII